MRFVVPTSRRDACDFDMTSGMRERSANFDQLSARDDGFAAVGKRVEREQDGGGVIVDDESRERGHSDRHLRRSAGKAVGVDVALTASSGSEIEFEVGVGSGSITNVIDGRSGQRSAAEIGVKDHAGGIDDGTKRIAESASQFVIDGSGKSGESEINFVLVDRTAGNLLTEAFENGARGYGNSGLAITGEQGLEIRRVHEPSVEGSLRKSALSVEGGTRRL